MILRILKLCIILCSCVQLTFAQITTGYMGRRFSIGADLVLRPDEVKGFGQSVGFRIQSCYKQVKAVDIRFEYFRTGSVFGWSDPDYELAFAPITAYGGEIVFKRFRTKGMAPVGIYFSKQIKLLYMKYSGISISHPYSMSIPLKTRYEDENMFLSGGVGFGCQRVFGLLLLDVGLQSMITLPHPDATDGIQSTMQECAFFSGIISLKIGVSFLLPQSSFHL